MPNMQLAVSYGVDYQNTLGLGYVVGEPSAPYTNLPQGLVNNGRINSAAYSLWMDDPTGTAATLLLGGVDTAGFWLSLMIYGMVV